MTSGMSGIEIMAALNPRSIRPVKIIAGLFFISSIGEVPIKKTLTEKHARPKKMTLFLEKTLQ